MSNTGHRLRRRRHQKNSRFKRKGKIFSQSNLNISYGLPLLRKVVCAHLHSIVGAIHHADRNIAAEHGIRGPAVFQRDELGQERGSIAGRVRQTLVSLRRDRRRGQRAKADASRLSALTPERGGMTDEQRRSAVEKALGEAMSDEPRIKDSVRSQS